jgi:uncharacterized protein (DUF111 family)
MCAKQQVEAVPTGEGCLKSTHSRLSRPRPRLAELAKSRPNQLVRKPTCNATQPNTGAPARSAARALV